MFMFKNKDAICATPKYNPLLFQIKNVCANWKEPELIGKNRGSESVSRGSAEWPWILHPLRPLSSRPLRYRSIFLTKPKLNLSETNPRCPQRGFEQLSVLLFYVLQSRPKFVCSRQGPRELRWSYYEGKRFFLRLIKILWAFCLFVFKHLFSF